MYVTEEEATQRWCPLVRAAFTWHNEETKKIELAVGGVNTSPGDRSKNPMSTCIGSRCMMWRASTLQKHKGFCGLAGNVATSLLQ